MIIKKRKEVESILNYDAKEIAAFILKENEFLKLSEAEPEEYLSFNETLKNIFYPINPMALLKKTMFFLSATAFAISLSINPFFSVYLFLLSVITAIQVD
ncbi:hypothetical protein [Pseudomonas sp. HY7a-MNA-CIBAN-0227]|uniref:hypothetical protein n=1 Tax=Pseudomonas sp. HY7a-MNA-CIBAN-0227 TaxID=3140474 RepID=UPI00331D3356